VSSHGARGWNKTISVRPENSSSRSCDRQKGKHFFFEKKKQKTAVHVDLKPKHPCVTGKGFWFFFSKKNVFLLYILLFS
jgi:hypothetical protein